jgi:uncharacterized membrane protein YraQ (UPF0718 family)
VYNIGIYLLAFALLGLSWLNNKGKTRQALKKAWKSFYNILPELVGVVVLIAVILSVLNPAVISRLLGDQSGALGYVLAAVVGAITLIPGFIAFPTAALLLQQGAGVGQIAVFVSTLMTVGVATAPLEVRYFGRRVTLLRNALAFVLAFVTAWVIVLVVGP